MMGIHSSVHIYGSKETKLVRNSNTCGSVRGHLRCTCSRATTLELSCAATVTLTCGSLASTPASPRRTSSWIAVRLCHLDLSKFAFVVMNFSECIPLFASSTGGLHAELIFRSRRAFKHITESAGARSCFVISCSYTLHVRTLGFVIILRIFDLVEFVTEDFELIDFADREFLSCSS